MADREAATADLLPHDLAIDALFAALGAGATLEEPPTPRRVYAVAGPDVAACGASEHGAGGPT